MGEPTREKRVGPNPLYAAYTPGKVLPPYNEALPLRRGNWLQDAILSDTGQVNRQAIDPVARAAMSSSNQGPPSRYYPEGMNSPEWLRALDAQALAKPGDDRPPPLIGWSGTPGAEQTYPLSNAVMLGYRSLPTTYHELTHVVDPDIRNPDAPGRTEDVETLPMAYEYAAGQAVPALAGYYAPATRSAAQSKVLEMLGVTGEEPRKDVAAMKAGMQAFRQGELKPGQRLPGGTMDYYQARTGGPDASAWKRAYDAYLAMMRRKQIPWDQTRERP